MSKQLESLLRESGLASDIQLRRVQERVSQGGGSFIEVLVTEERVPDDAIADAFIERLRVPRCSRARFRRSARAAPPARTASGCVG